MPNAIGVLPVKEIDPRVKRIAFMFNPQTAPYYPLLLRQFGAAAASLATELLVTPVRSEAEVEAAITALVREPSHQSHSPSPGAG